MNPDIAMFGKALGNGYAINAIIGKSAIMQAAQDTFISSTFWTEKLGCVAANETLKVMEEVSSWNIITEIGKNVTSIWARAAAESGLELQVSGLPALSSFNFVSEFPLAQKTLLTKEMLNLGYLSGNAFYPSICHTEIILEEYEENLTKSFKYVAKFSTEADIVKHLDGGVCHSGFQRLN